MTQVTYQALAPLLSGEGSRAFLGLKLDAAGGAHPVVFVWVPSELSEDLVEVEQLRAETQVAVGLDHPHIIRVHGLARLEEGIARVVEYVDGETLDTFLKAFGRLPVSVAAKLVCEAALGVHYAHLAGTDDGSPLIHGDLRPSTLMVSYEGVCKVAGYGALTVAPRELGGRRVPGRRQHHAPEQLLADRAAMTPATDVYHLGLTLYECVSGRVPFIDASDFDVAVLTQGPPRLEHDDVPEALNDILAKALAKGPGDRFPTPLALKEALESILAPLPSSAEVAAFLATRFPKDTPTRTARLALLQDGMRAVRTSRPPPAPPSEAPAPAPAPAPEKLVTSARLAQPEARPARPPRTGGTRGFVVGLSVGAVAASALTVLLLQGRREREGKPAVLAAAAVAQTSPSPSPSPSASPAASTSPVPAPDPGSSGPPAPSEGPPREEQSRKATAPASPTLAVFVDPEVDLLLDGKPFGRSPHEGPVGLGRHVLTLSEPGRGIRTSRVITITRPGRTVERIYLSRGYVRVNAPDGATVFINGRRVGVAPLDELTLFEGKYKLRVSFQGASWEESFALAAEERLSFDVTEQ